MNIVMLTNTFTPHVGGVARSVAAFTQRYRQLGHKVLVVAPEFDDMPSDEPDVLRIPALQRFNGGDFSVVLPVSGLLRESLDAFRPSIVHSHHPYLLGMTALRIARYRELPLVFTHHTLYEQYTHYVPGDSPPLKRFAIELATQYANLADQVFAPSESIRDLIRQRGVTTAVDVVPTGVDLAHFESGDGERFRAETGIPSNAFVVGHLGRLAPEKNLRFLAAAVAAFISDCGDEAHFLIGGEGPEKSAINRIFTDAGLARQVHFTGALEWEAVSDAYHAMDVFAFASKSETQGMVLTEAMAAGVPVVALDGSGVREVVEDGINGCLLREQDSAAFAASLHWVAQQSPSALARLRQGAYATAARFSLSACAEQALQLYGKLEARTPPPSEDRMRRWHHLLRLIKAEWDILEGVVEGAKSATAEVLSKPKTNER